MYGINVSDGISVDDSNYILDSRTKKGEINVVSHAHYDHLHQNNDKKIFSSNVTARLASERMGKCFDNFSNHKNIKLIDSGHIIGSSSVLIEKCLQNKSVLYTSDFSTRERLYLNGFDPVPADILIIETTYGLPQYVFPSQEEIEQDISNFLSYNQKPKFLFGYSLGKAQKIQKLIQKHSDKQILVDNTVAKMNKAIEKSTDLSFDYRIYNESVDKSLIASDDAVYVGSTSKKKTDKIERLVDELGGLKTGFSGWSINKSYKFRTGMDVTFPLSDHADFNELTEVVEKVNPEQVFTVHGFIDKFASHLRSKKGINARSLKSNQSSLADF